MAVATIIARMTASDVEKLDVLVLGGGPAHVVAAVRAARLGARTALPIARVTALGREWSRTTRAGFTVPHHYSPRGRQPSFSRRPKTSYSPPTASPPPENHGSRCYGGVSSARVTDRRGLTRRGSSERTR